MRNIGAHNSTSNCRSGTGMRYPSSQQGIEGRRTPKGSHEGRRRPWIRRRRMWNGPSIASDGWEGANRRPVLAVHLARRRRA